MKQAERRKMIRRASELVAHHELREPKARAVALSELGYSNSGIAGVIDSTEGTVESYLSDVAERFGQQARFPKPETERDGPLGPKGPEK